MLSKFLNRKKTVGQATLEMTLAVIATMLLFMGTAKIFLWFGYSLRGSQRNFDYFRYAPKLPVGSPSKPLRVLPEEINRHDLPRTFSDYDEFDGGVYIGDGASEDDGEGEDQFEGGGWNIRE